MLNEGLVLVMLILQKLIGLQAKNKSNSNFLSIKPDSKYHFEALFIADCFRNEMFFYNNVKAA